MVAVTLTNDYPGQQVRVLSNSKMSLDVSQHDLIETAFKEFALIKETIHSEADIWVVDLSAAFGYNMTRIKSVMHHYQNHWFTRRFDVESICDVCSNS